MMAHVTPGSTVNVGTPVASELPGYMTVPIIVMNDGAITGVGTHDELLAGNTEYQEIYYSQNEREPVKGGAN